MDSIENADCSTNITSNSKLSKKLAELRKWQLQEEENLKRLQKETSKLNEVINYADDDILSNAEDENSIEHLRADNNRQNLTPILEKFDESSQDFVSLEKSDTTEDNTTLKNVDDLPVTPGIDGKNIKSFEELLKKSIETDQILVDTDEKPKWPYLKKGTGLKKYQPLSQSKKFTRNCSKRNLAHNKADTSESIKTRQAREFSTTEIGEKTILKGEPKNIENSVYSCREDAKVATRKITFDTKVETNNNSYKEAFSTKGHLRFKPSKAREKVEDKKSSKLDAVVDSRYASKPIAMVERHIQPENVILDIESETRVNYLRRLLELIRTKKVQLIEESLKKRENVLLKKDEQSEEPVQIQSKLKEGLLKEKEVYDGPKKLDSYMDKLDEKFIPNLSMPRENCYTRSLKSKIDVLEERLKSLQLKCYQRKLNLKKEQDKIFSPENLMKEIVNIKEQLNSVNNELHALQLMAAQSNIMMKPRKCSNEVKTIVLKNSDENSTINDNEKIDEIESNEKCRKNNTDESGITFENGDRIRRTKDNKIIYEYANGSRQITYPDGLRVLESLNGRVEIIHTNGVKHIYYPNNSQKIVHPGAAEQTFFENLYTNSVPQRKLELQNDDKKIKTSDFKKKLYVDGTVKIIYNDGIQEIRYPNGRRKIKNPRDIILDAMS